jgi:hypothetical protein
MIAGCKKKEGDYSGRRKRREMEQKGQEKGNTSFLRRHCLPGYVDDVLHAAWYGSTRIPGM